MQATGTLITILFLSFLFSSVASNTDVLHKPRLPSIFRRQNTCADGTTACGSECMTSGSVCCGDDSGTSCPANHYCVSGGCCPNGQKCEFPSGTATVSTSSTMQTSQSGPATVTVTPAQTPVERTAGGLSTGAKAGIGVGVGVGGLVILAAVAWWMVVLRRRQKQKREQEEKSKTDKGNTDTDVIPNPFLKPELDTSTQLHELGGESYRGPELDGTAFHEVDGKSSVRAELDGASLHK